MIQHPPRAGDDRLVRAIGPLALGVNMVNLTVGGGIFVLPGVIAAQLGAAAILAYLVCSAAVALVFLCFAEIGSRVTRSGGAYAYIEDAFGPFAGFAAWVLLWFGWNVLSDAALTVALTDAVATQLPLLVQPLPRATFMVGLCAGLAWVNVIGVRTGVRFVLVNTAIKLVPLLLLIAAGLFAVNRDFLTISKWPDVPSFGAGALILFFAFAGAESGLNASGEIANPVRTVPRGVALGMSGILLIYLGLQTVAQGVLGPELAKNADAPLAAVARVVLGAWGGGLLFAASVMSIFATLSGDILGAPRVVFASARDGHLPAFLAKVHHRYKTPFASIVFFAALIAALAISGTFRFLAVVASGSILLVYLGVSLSVIRLRRRDGPPPPGSFALPWGHLIPALSCAVVSWLLIQLTRAEAVGLATLAGVSVLLYAVRTQVRR